MSTRRALATSLLLLIGSAACGDSTPPPKAPPPQVSASVPPPSPLSEDEKPLPLDKRITHGKLENGLTYYILPHQKPEKRAQIWLAVNAGSVLEDDDQRGLAHFVEHMAFNGTKRFPKGAIVDFVEKSGIRFGADLNAYTSFDETVYTLQVPTDKPELVAKGFQVLRDWAGDVTFEPDEVEKERGVVLEEWRLGRGAGMRLFDKTSPVVFFGSKYAERLPIGKPDIIKKAPRDTLVRFYKDWYRPDLMAVIAVGDFQAADIEAKIKADFKDLPAAKTPKPRPAATMPMHDKTLVTIETDPEQTSTSVSLVTKMPHRPEKSARDYRREVAERLFNMMLNARFDEIRRQPNAPFLSAFSSTGSLLRPADSFTQGATVKEDGVQAGFEALLEEVLRVERHGFTTGELERAKKQLLRSYEQTVKEYEKRDSRGFAQELVRNFLVEELAPGPEVELAMVEKFLPTYSIAELNEVGKKLGGGSRVIRVTGPSTMAKPTAEAMLASNKTVEARKITPYEDAGAGMAIMEKIPQPVPVAKTKAAEGALGITEWTLKNGIKVVVKPTTFSNDEVRIVGFSPGGTSLVKDADYDTARFADTVVGLGGVGNLDATKLRKALAGKFAQVSTNISELTENVSANGSPQDLETIFQLVHLSFTAPRKDEAAFQAWKTRELESVKNRRLSPETTFAEDFTVFETNNHLRRRPTTVEMVNKVNLDKAMEIYKDRFGDAGDFTFVVVGNVNLDSLKPLVETYLGSLPSKGRKETWKDVNVTWPAGTPKKEVVKGSEPKSSVVIAFHGVEKWSRDTENDMRMLGEVLGMRYREVLREDMSGVYGVSAFGNITRRPHPEYQFNVRFGCAPENVDKLQKAVFDEAKAIAEKGIGEDYISKVKELRKRAYETNLKDNGFWVRELERAYTFNDDPKWILDAQAMTDKITSDRVKEAAKKYINTKSYVVGVLKPEGAAAPAK